MNAGIADAGCWSSASITSTASGRCRAMVDAGAHGRALPALLPAAHELAPAEAAMRSSSRATSSGEPSSTRTMLPTWSSACDERPVGTSLWEGMTATTELRASGSSSSGVAWGSSARGTRPMSSALAVPSSVPATMSSGKCAPNSTRVNATAATYAQSTARRRGNANAMATAERRGDRHVPARERVEVAPGMAVQRLATSTVLLGARRSYTA